VNDRVEAAVGRFAALHPRLIDLSLERITALLGKLGHPERRLAPVIHIAGTNGKGSTAAFIRTIAEAAGWHVNVYTSPHLVRFNERIRLAGELASDAMLERMFADVEALNAGAPITQFEVATAVALHLFAQVPADLCVLEVGLGGRFDATNVIERPAACAITSISLDHREFLGDTLSAIAFEKAGILKRQAEAVTGEQAGAVSAVLEARAIELGCRLRVRGRDWTIAATQSGCRFADAEGTLDLPAPALAGEFQLDNAGIAISALRAAGFAPSPDAIAAGLAGAEWPARLQRLGGRLASLLPATTELWLDGGHNAGAGSALGHHLESWQDAPVHLIVGMRQSKDVAEFLRPLLGHAASIRAVAEPGQYLAMPVEEIVAASAGAVLAGGTVVLALKALAAEFARGIPKARVLICGSLYLAGEVLKADQLG
jgi:dihydrofolate synthase/folylpolyglutamate synthase